MGRIRLLVFALLGTLLASGCVLPPWEDRDVDTTHSWVTPTIARDCSFGGDPSVDENRTDEGAWLERVEVDWYYGNWGDEQYVSAVVTGYNAAGRPLMFAATSRLQMWHVRPDSAPSLIGELRENLTPQHFDVGRHPYVSSLGYGMFADCLVPGEEYTATVDLTVLATSKSYSANHTRTYNPETGDASTSRQSPA